MTDGSATLLSIIVPVKDEAAVVAAFVERVVPILEDVTRSAPGSWEIIFIDDGSTDGTFQKIEFARQSEPRIKCLSFSRNFGKEAALSAGLHFAQGDAIVPMDVDMQDPPEVLGEMVEKWRQGGEVVYGVRRNRTSDSLPKRMTADLYYRAHNWVSNDKIPKHAGDFRLLDRKVVDAIKLLPERNRFMKGIFAWSGFQQDWVEYDRDGRHLGTTKFNYLKLWGLALDGITSSSTLPLRIWSYVGFVIAIFSFFYAIFVVANAILFGNPVAGYSSLMAVILFLSGIQLMSLGIIGEYLGRVLVEAKMRPLYIVRKKLGLDDPT